MTNRMDFTAIDFETANHRRDSACQLAAVTVSGGKIVDRQMWLIRPRPFYFSPRNIEVHGIRPAKVASEPEFGNLWESISPYLQTSCVVAHNAPFDIGVLLECLRAHSCTIPAMQFTCTRLIARAAWPGRSGYGLKKIAEWLGIDFRHHDALEDSVACAKILLAAAATTGATTLAELEGKLKLSRGLASATEYQGAKRVTRARTTRRYSGATTEHVKEPPAVYEPAIDLQRLLVRAEFLRRLAGKRVVIAGDLRSLSRENAELLARKLGATLQDHITINTDVVILGSHETRMALAMRYEGQPLQLLTEDELIGLVQHAEPVLT